MEKYGADLYAFTLILGVGLRASGFMLYDLSLDDRGHSSPSRFWPFR